MNTKPVYASPSYWRYFSALNGGSQEGKKYTYICLVDNISRAVLLCPNVFSLFLSVLQVHICCVYLNISDGNTEAVNVSVNSKAFLHVESRYSVCILPTVEFNFKVLQKSENNLIGFGGKKISILTILRWHNYSFLYPMTMQVSQECRGPHINTISCCLFNKSLVFIASYKAFCWLASTSYVLQKQ